MVDSKAKPYTPQRLMTVSVVGLLLAIGLCGVGSAFKDNNGSIFFQVIAGATGFVSLLGLVVGLVWGVLRSIYGRREI
jgi:hypothetical protein